MQKVSNIQILNADIASVISAYEVSRLHIAMIRKIEISYGVGEIHEEVKRFELKFELGGDVN